MIENLYGSLAVEIDDDDSSKIISVTEGGKKITIGSQILVTKFKLGPRIWSIGKIVSIEHPHRYGTNNIFGVDFENCGRPTAQLNITHFQVLTTNRG